MKKIFEKNARLAMATGLMMAILFSGCKKPREEPTLEPKPVAVELGIGTITRGAIIQDNKMTTEWGINDVVHLWAKGEELDKPMPFDLTWNGSKWVTPQMVDGKKLAKATSIVASYLPKGAGNIVVTPHGFTFTPSPTKDKEVGEFTISQYYTDILVADTGAKMSAITATLQSPYRQVELIIKNSSWTQEVSNISIKIDGAIGEATYTHEGWKGTSQAITISHKKEKWEGSEADTILLAFPTLSQSVSATITYTNSNGEKTETITTDGGSIVFTLASEEITNPALAFTPPIDVEYWKKANQDAFNLITNNYAGELTEEQARNHGWNQVRPLVDETMCSKQLYKDDMNVIEWLVLMEKKEESGKRDWGYAMGLETLDGKLVEVYPPQYDNYAGGGLHYKIPGGHYFVSAQAGKYRLVFFISYPEEWVGKDEYGKWYKLPMLDAITGFEALNVGGDYRKKYLEPVPMEKSPYKDIDIIEVVDRNSNNLVAPRWYMGYIYQDREAYKKNEYLNKAPEESWWSRKYKAGDIIAVTAVNTTNQQLQGTVVAKVEYLPMFNQIGQWRLDQTAQNHSTKVGTYYSTQWSKEVGRTEVTILPNSEQKVAVELIQVDYGWLSLGGRGSARLGPAPLIHFYWVENGKETMMMGIDYPMTNRMQQHSFGDANNKTADWDDNSIRSQPRAESPGQSFVNRNGFTFW